MSNITTLMEFLNNPIIDASTYALRYMGHYDKDREYALGDVIYDKNSDVFSVCTSENKFEPISSGIAEKPYTEVPTNKYKLIGKCPYCNASLNLTKFN